MGSAAVAKPEPKITILADAALRYLDELRNGKGELIELGPERC
jgi:hypothetical protein